MLFSSRVFCIESKVNEFVDDATMGDRSEASLPMDIPATYKAVVFDRPGEISTKVVELETPKPGPGEVLVRLYVYCRTQVRWLLVHRATISPHKQVFSLLTVNLYTGPSPGSAPVTSRS